MRRLKWVSKEIRSLRKASNKKREASAVSDSRRAISAHSGIVETRITVDDVTVDKIENNEAKFFPFLLASYLPKVVLIYTTPEQTQSPSFVEITDALAYIFHMMIRRITPMNNSFGDLENVLNAPKRFTNSGR